MSGFAALGLSLSLVAQPAQDLFPGRWVPVEIGIVRYVERPEGAWEKPKLEITLEWQPQDPDRLRWLSVEECREASERAAHDFGPMMDTFILAGDQVYHPRAAVTSFRYGGPAEVRMLFDLPEGLPETVDLFVWQWAAEPEPARESVSASAPLTDEPEGRWQTGPVTWTLDRVEPGVKRPAPREAGLPQLYPGPYATWGIGLPGPEPPEKVTRVTLIGTMGVPTSLAFLHLRRAVLRGGAQEWSAFRLTRAQKQHALAAGVDGRLRPQSVPDPEARPYLIIWFPVPDLPDGCELALEGELYVDPAEMAREHVFSGLPNPLAP
jgi:hypothetical protein